MKTLIKFLEENNLEHKAIDNGKGVAIILTRTKIVQIFKIGGEYRVDFRCFNKLDELKEYLTKTYLNK